MSRTARLLQLMDVLRSRLICGAALTLADFAAAAPLAEAERARLPLGGFTHLARWFTSIQSLEAWRKTAV